MDSSSKQSGQTTASQALPPQQTQPNAVAQSKWDKWVQDELEKGRSMISTALTNEDHGRQTPSEVSVLEYCPMASRSQEIVLSGWLAVKTSGGWTRSWQARYCVLTRQFLYMFKRAPPANATAVNPTGPRITAALAGSVIGATAPIGHDIFGEFRDSIPIDGDVLLCKHPALPNTFQISYPSRPRLLLRAASMKESDKWVNSIYFTCALSVYPVKEFASGYFLGAASTPKAQYSVIPHIKDIVPGYLDRATLLSTLSIAPNVKAKELAFSLILRTDLQYTTVYKFPIISPLSLETARLTLTMGDGGRLCIPLETLIDRTSQDCATVSVGPCKGFYDGLFIVNQGTYNTDIHIAWKMEQQTYPGSALQNLYKTGSFGASPGVKDMAARLALAKLPASKAAPAAASGDHSHKNKHQHKHNVCSTPLEDAPLLPNRLDSVLFALGGLLMALLPDLQRADAVRSWIIVFFAYIACGMLLYIGIISKNYVYKSNTSVVSTNLVVKPVVNTILDVNTLNTGVYPTEITLPVISLIFIRMINRHAPHTTPIVLSGAPVVLKSVNTKTGEQDQYPPVPNFTISTPVMLDDYISTGNSTLSLTKAVSSINMGDLISYEDDPNETNGEELEDDIYLEGFRSVDNKSEETENSKYLEHREVIVENPLVGNVYQETWGSWSASDHRGLLLRGPDYLVDRKKIPADPFTFSVAHCEFIGVEKFQSHACNWKNSYFKRQKQRAIELGRGADWGPGSPFKYMVVNYLVPSSPNYNLVIYFRNDYIYPSPFPEDIVAKKQQEHHESSPGVTKAHYPDDPFFGLMQKFINGDDEFKKTHFKYIPNVAEGSWFVKKGVGNTPAIMGNKLTQTYFQDADKQYLEIDIDVSSSSVGGSILRLVKGYAKNISVDQNFLLEAKEEADLPERLWGGLRCNNIDLTKVPFVEIEDLIEE